MKNKLLLPLLFVTLLFSASCSKDVNPDEGIYGPGIFVSNEGTFNLSNASISYIPRTNYQCYNDIYASANEGAVMGDVLQSVYVHNDKVYAVLNNSQKVIVIHLENFAYSGVISDRNLPRYMAFNGNRGYLTEWFDFSGNGRLSIINLTNNSVVKQILVGKLPEKLLIHDNLLYVTNSNDSTISVINMTYEIADHNITVGDWPNGIVKDANDKLWILCSGIPSWAGSPTNGKLVKYNPASQIIELSLEFPSSDFQPAHLCINHTGNELFYHYDGKVYSMGVNASALPSQAIITTPAYGMGIDPESGYLFVADAGDYVTNGLVKWYSTAGASIGSASVGIAPNGFFFLHD